MAARRVLRIATRASPLARWQADHVATALAAQDPAVSVEVVPLDTVGDRRRDVPISAMGGKGVFAKEVQTAVLDGHSDLAVHSAKDLPSVPVDGLVLAAVPERGDPRDALVGAPLAALPPGAQVATGSVRRRVQLAERRPDLVFHELRGNMATRLAKASHFHAIVVAAVALQRLQLDAAIAEVLAVDVMLPQVGQGALAVECRAEDRELRARLAGIEHPLSRRCVDAERAFLAELGGDCDLPAGAHAMPVDGGDQDGGDLKLTALLAAPDGVTIRRHSAIGREPEPLGQQVAQTLRDA